MPMFVSVDPWTLKLLKLLRENVIKMTSKMPIIFGVAIAALITVAYWSILQNENGI